MWEAAGPDGSSSIQPFIDGGEQDRQQQVTQTDLIKRLTASLNDGDKWHTDFNNRRPRAFSLLCR